MNRAFTLAEVLITLGIIGVIAAMTIPSVMTKYQKQETAARLKKAYSTINQALVMSQSENGDFTTWEGIVPEDMPSVNYQNRLSLLVKQNIIPYLKVQKDCGIKCKSASDEIYRDGQVQKISNDPSNYVIYLSDGTRIRFFINNRRDENGVATFQDLYIVLDINGDSKPNLAGRDIFFITLSSSNNKVQMYNTNYPLSNNLSECENGRGFSCGAIIQKDGWEINDHYPW